MATLDLSIFDIFKIGIGPSSSHTMGPMRAACAFTRQLKDADLLDGTASVAVQLYGSLALTGKGHGTDRAVLVGLEGGDPETVEPDTVVSAVGRISTTNKLRLGGERAIAFDPKSQLQFQLGATLPRHSNAMRFIAYDRDGEVLLKADYYSIGGGFIVRGDEKENNAAQRSEPPYPFQTGDELLSLCRERGLSIFELVKANERTWRSNKDIQDGIQGIWSAMQVCVERGFRQRDVLPGPLRIARRAPAIYLALTKNRANDAMQVLDWVNAWALAVNEENASGGRVVTAPTNGAAGIIPSVLHYYRRFEPRAEDAGIERFLLTAGAIAMLYKHNASISGAEMGCQGEVGVACSMAAAGLVAALNGTNSQIENAAEIGMEHNLGLTCDPVGGLVQIPCIERNAMGSVKAINAARLALSGDGSHKVSLDQVIATMRQTGLDMAAIYKETSQGGLAVNVPEC